MHSYIHWSVYIYIQYTYVYTCIHKCMFTYTHMMYKNPKALIHRYIYIYSHMITCNV